VPNKTTVHKETKESLTDTTVGDEDTATYLYREQRCSTSGGCESHIAIRHRVAAL